MGDGDAEDDAVHRRAFRTAHSMARMSLAMAIMRRCGWDGATMAGIESEISLTTTRVDWQ